MHRDLVSLQPISGETLRACAENPALAEFFRRLPPTWTLSNASLEKAAESLYALQVGDEMVGILALTSFEPFSKRVELGLGLFQRRRLRYAIEAVRMALDYVFNGLGYHKVICQFLAHRRDIRLVLGRFGFQQEACLRESLFWRGNWHDEIVMSLLDREFNNHG